MARLAQIYDYMFIRTRFEQYGRAEGQSLPYPYEPDPMGSHLADTEYFLRSTQHRLDTLRVELETLAARNRALETQLQAAKRGRTYYTKKAKACQDANTILRGRLKTAKEDLATRDARIEELEEENDELRKENNDLLPDDDVPSDGMDMSDPSDQEDDDLAGDSEEDPEERIIEVDDGDD